MSKVDISSEAVERLAKTADLFAKAMKTWQHKTQKHNEDVRDTLRAQAERIKELEGQKAAGLRREKDANERAMKHLRRAEKAEIASKNHAAFSHEWRERAENAEAENAILRTEKHADAEAIGAMKEAGMDRLVAEGQRCDAMTPQEAAKVSAEARENIVDEIESIICETHEMDVRDIDYAENIVSWLERHHPAALRAISEDSQ